MPRAGGSRFDEHAGPRAETVGPDEQVAGRLAAVDEAHPHPAVAEASQVVFTDLVMQLEELSEEFDDDQLATVVRFLRGAAARQLEATRRLTDGSGSEPG